MTSLNSLPGISHQPLAQDELSKIHAYWRAANYLSVVQIYLYANPLLREPLKIEHVKRRLLGHFGTTPGLNFIYAHFNRVIKKYDLNVIYICGPGHGGPGMVANAYLEGTYTELYPNIQQNEAGMQKLFKQFSFPGGIPGHEPEHMHQLMAASLDHIVEDIHAIQNEARTSRAAKNSDSAVPEWPMIVLRTPKGWTGPKTVDGKQVEGTWRAHQVPVADIQEKPEHLKILEDWMRSYRPEELFDEQGKLVAELSELAPKGDRRMSANPHANGGLLLRDLVMPDFRKYAVKVKSPGTEFAESTRVLGGFLRDVMKLNLTAKNFRVFGPDENASNRLEALYEATGKEWMEPILPVDENLSRDGRLLELHSGHMCQVWLEGYLLTGRHGFFSCYEAFIHIIDSMFNQHAKWLKVTRNIEWLRPISSLNYLLTSHVWRQDHNGFTHQDPGFIDHVINKKADVVRVYLPPDANCVLSVTDHCLRSRHYVNVIVAGKQAALQWLDMESAIEHCSNGIG